MQPKMIIVGADKGGVGKTTISRALLGYLASNSKGDITRAFDTEPEPGVLKRYWPDKTSVVDLTSSDGQMVVFDTLKSSPITIIDTKAGILSNTLQTLDDIGFMEKAKEGELKLTLLHVLGGSLASFSEIKSVAQKLSYAQHYLIKNQINDNSFFKWSPEMSQLLTGGVIEIPKLDAKAGEHADVAGGSFEKFRDDATQSEVLRGYMRFWLKRVYAAFDAAGLNSV